MQKPWYLFQHWKWRVAYLLCIQVLHARIDIWTWVLDFVSVTDCNFVTWQNWCKKYLHICILTRYFLTWIHCTADDSSNIGICWVTYDWARVGQIGRTSVIKSTCDVLQLAPGNRLLIVLPANIVPWWAAHVCCKRLKNWRCASAGAAPVVSVPDKVTAQLRQVEMGDQQRRNIRLCYYYYFISHHMKQRVKLGEPCMSRPLA